MVPAGVACEVADLRPLLSWLLYVWEYFITELGTNFSGFCDYLVSILVALLWSGPGVLRLDYGVFVD